MKGSTIKEKNDILNSFLKMKTSVSHPKPSESEFLGLGVGEEGREGEAILMHTEV